MMHLPARPTPFAKLIDLGPDGQVLLFIGDVICGGVYGPALTYATNGAGTDLPVMVIDPINPHDDAKRKIAEYDEDDARKFVNWVREREARKEKTA